MPRPSPAAFLAASALLLAATGAVAAPGRPFTPDDLTGLDRVSAPRVSPDGRRVVYDVRSTDLEANKGVRALWLASLAGGSAPRRLAAGSAPRWGADGRVYYLAPAGGTDQVWSLAPDGGLPRQVTRLPLDVGAFRLSADGRRLVVSMAVVPGAETATVLRAQAAPAAPHGSGQVYDRLFVRHWDTWADGTRNHLFALQVGADGTAAGDPTPLIPGFDGDVPGKPFGGEEDFSLSPDGRTVYFSARLAGRSEPWSTNFDVYAVPADGSAPPRDLTSGNKAWDASPVVSPDGRTLAWRAMRRPGFEADRFTVWTMDLASGAKRELTGAWDRSPGPIQWSPDGRALYATADDEGQVRLFRVDAATGAVRTLSDADEHVADFDLAAGAVVYGRESFSHPAVLAARPLAGGAARLIGSDPNAQRLSGVATSEARRFVFTGWNGEAVHGYVFLPPGLKPGAKAPVAFLIHGGPQGSWDGGWSYRWNPQTYAGRGYAVVLVDFHGSTGYGQAFTDAISGHWGDRPLEDLQKGWAAALHQFPQLDGDRACALGASYGGFMVNWIAGVWNAPWKCLVTHDGVFDDRSMGFSTDELWFSEWEHGGPDHTPWNDPAAYERFNPALHVADWRRPQLIIHGGRDYRIPLEQGLGAFDALQRRGVESRLLYFPDENHWVLKPRNSLQWNAVVLDWLDSHLKR